MSSIDFHVLLPVWGEDYVDLFLTLTLPAQLSDGNIPYLRNISGNHRYKIYTSRYDAQRIERSPAYSKLANLIETEINYIDDLLEVYNKAGINQHGAMTICHARGVEDANLAGAAVIFLCSDTIIADGGIKRISEVAMWGKRAIMTGGYRVAKSIIPEVIRRYSYPEKHCISIPPRDLVKLSLANIPGQSFVNRNFTDGGWPSNLYWKVGEEGVIQRGMHLLPIMVNPLNKVSIVDNSILEDPATFYGHATDGSDYVRQAVPDYDDVYIVEDSDELVIFDVFSQSGCSSGKEEINPPDRLFSFKMAIWMNENLYPYHVRYFKHRIRFHYGKFSSIWEEVEAESNTLVDDVYACLQLLNTHVLKIRNILTYENIDDIFCILDEVIENTEKLVEKDKLEKASMVFSKVLENVENVRATLMNNIAVIHIKEGRLEIARWLLEQMVREGIGNDIAVANLQVLEELMRNHACSENNL